MLDKESTKMGGEKGEEPESMPNEPAKRNEGRPGMEEKPEYLIRRPKPSCHILKIIKDPIT